MTVRQQLGIATGVIIALAVAALIITRTHKDELFPVTLGSPAPDFSAKALDGSGATRTLASYKGKLLLLNVWATYCVPCKVEMPSFERLHRTYGSKGLAIVAVSIDAPGKEKEILAFAKKLGLTFEIVYDAEGNIQTQYQTTGVPESFVIDSSGTIVKKVIGAEDWMSGANRALIANLLGVPLVDTAAMNDSGRARDTLLGAYQPTTKPPR